MATSILTIDPGTRKWGVAVFRGGMLSAFYPRNLSAKDSPATRRAEVRKVFSSLCRRYSPQVVILKKPKDHWVRQSEHLSLVWSSLSESAQHAGLRTFEVSSEDVRLKLCGNTGATKDNLVLVIRRFDRDLGDWLIQEKVRRDRCTWGRLVESAALGVCFLNMRRSLR